MSSMVLKSNYVPSGTFIPDLFIDKYMPPANGAYVKVYIYLLHCISKGYIKEIDISSIADHLDNTERDILRALCYWEKVDLISLERNDKDDITSITLNDVYSTYHSNEHIEEPAATIDPTDYNTINTEHQEQSNDFNKDKPNIYQFEKPTYSEAQIKQLTNTDEVKWMLNIIEIYLQRLIKPMDLQLILYLYESLDFSTELILYLYEYCVSKNKTHPSYVEAVALAWAKDGIDSLEKAEEATTQYNESHNLVKKAFGLNRSLGHVEKQYINKWTKQYNLSIDIIIEACNRTLLSINKPDFKYTDKIIENWHKNKATNLNKIKALDEEHAKKSSNKLKNKEKTNTNNKHRKQDNNRFNAFPQRSYSEEEYSTLEQRLLHKQ